MDGGTYPRSYSVSLTKMIIKSVPYFGLAHLNYFAGVDNPTTNQHIGCWALAHVSGLLLPVLSHLPAGSGMGAGEVEAGEAPCCFHTEVAAVGAFWLEVCFWGWKNAGAWKGT